MIQGDREWAKDTAIVFVVVCLLIFFLYRLDTFLVIATFLSAAAVLWPAVLTPLGRGWKLLAHYLQKIVSPIVFTLIFFVFVVPTAVAWRFVKRPGKGLSSKRTIFVDRSHCFGAPDLEAPY